MMGSEEERQQQRRKEEESEKLLAQRHGCYLELELGKWECVCCKWQGFVRVLAIDRLERDPGPGGGVGCRLCNNTSSTAVQRGGGSSQQAVDRGSRARCSVASY